MSEPQVTVLENGLTVVTQQVPSRQTAIDLAVKAGGRHETRDEKGSAHFLEHMLLSDTVQHTVAELAAKTENMYGAMHGGTGYESVHLERQCRTAHTPEALEMLADAVLHPRMDPERFEKERNSILREWSESAAEEMSGSAVVQKLAFPGSGLEKPIDGAKSQIKKLTQEKLQIFRDKHFTAPNMVLTVVGDVQHEEIVAQAEQLFADLPNHAPKTAEATKPAHYRGGIKFWDEEQAESTSIQMGFEASASGDVEGQAKDVLLSGLLAGASDNSRLDKRLRFEQGDVYAVESELKGFADNGILSISAECDVERGADVMGIICEELRDLPHNLTKDELEATKRAVIGELERGEAMDSVSICERLSHSTIANGRPLSLDDEINAIEAVSLEDMKHHAQKVFGSAPSISIRTDFEVDFPDYIDITTMLGKPREVDESDLVIEENAPSADRAVAGAEISAQPAKAKAQHTGHSR